jgi:hypothetical protein
MVVEISDPPPKKKTSSFYLASKAPPFLPFTLWYHVLLCHVEGDGVCSLMGWLDVISTVLLRVFLFMTTLLPNQFSLSLSLSHNSYSDAFFFAIAAVSELSSHSVQNWSLLGLRIQFLS